MIAILDSKPLQVETKAWLSALPGKPSKDIILAVNQFIKTCKTDGNLSLLDRFWLFGQDNQANSLYSIINPTSTAATETAAPTWTSLRGYDFNGTTQYLKTNSIPSTLTNFALNSSSLGVYCIENTNTAFGWDIGCYNATVGSALSLRDGTSSAYTKINALTSAITTIGSITDSRGLWVGTRTASTTTAIFRNGSSLGGDADASNAVPTTELYIGALNNNGTPGQFTDRKIALAFVGSGAINQATFYTAIQALATSIGFNV